MTPTPKIRKKTLYIDVEDEITGIIDKVRSAEEQILAIVVPKRASTFLSAVNMKLLKRAADQSKKKIVLITSHQNVLPLAGLAGIHVASNLNSKPYIPSLPEAADEEPETDESSIEIESQPPAAAVKSSQSKNDDSKSRASIKNSSKSPAPQAVAAKSGAVAALETVVEETVDATTVKKLKKPKLKVPNFNRFRLGLIIAAALVVVLAGFGYWALVIAPKAVATIRGETKTSSLSFVMKANTKATALNADTAEVPSKIKEIKKSETEKVATTGQKDKGNKASGTMSLKNCSRSDGSVNIPAGTGVSSGDLTFITQAAVSLDPSEFTGGGTCKSDSKEVAVIAQNAGDKFNVSSRTYTVAGASGVSATGSAMTGGTSEIVKVVSASDVESAKTKLGNKQNAAIEELKAGLDAEGYIPLADTIVATPGNYVPTPAVDSEASEVIVSVETKYTMIGVKKSELQELIKAKAAKDGGIDLTKQSILDDGLAGATYQLGATTPGVTDVTVKTNVLAGPDIDKEVIKKEIAGQKRGIAEQKISARPGIKEVRIETSPFWNYSVPKKTDKITIIVEESNGTVVKP